MTPRSGHLAAQPPRNTSRDREHSSPVHSAPVPPVDPDAFLVQQHPVTPWAQTTRTPPIDIPAATRAGAVAYAGIVSQAT